MPKGTFAATITRLALVLLMRHCKAVQAEAGAECEITTLTGAELQELFAFPQGNTVIFARAVVAAK